MIQIVMIWFLPSSTDVMAYQDSCRPLHGKTRFWEECTQSAWELGRERGHGELLRDAAATEAVAGGAAGATSKAANLTEEQLANIERFKNKIPANAKDSVVQHPLPNNGVAVQATSPGKVPGSSAVYEKQIDSAGQTI